MTIAAAGSARAHGDPASHYLETDSFYPSFASQPSQEVQLRLLGLLQASEKRGYPIKVALVAGREDLVDDQTMIRTPQRYAEFVVRSIGRELRAPVLIVTPHGLGVAGRQRQDGRLSPVTAAGARTLVRGVDVPPRAEGEDLARTAMVAIRRIARAGGRALPARVPPAEMYTPPARPAQPAAARAAESGGAGALLPAVPAIAVALAFLVGYLRSRRAAAPART